MKRVVASAAYRTLNVQSKHFRQGELTFDVYRWSTVNVPAGGKLLVLNANYIFDTLAHINFAELEDNEDMSALKENLIDVKQLVINVLNDASRRLPSLLKSLKPTLTHEERTWDDDHQETTPDDYYIGTAPDRIVINVELYGLGKMSTHIALSIDSMYAWQFNPSNPSRKDELDDINLLDYLPWTNISYQDRDGNTISQRIKDINRLSSDSNFVKKMCREIVANILVVFNHSSRKSANMK